MSKEVLIQCLLYAVHGALDQGHLANKEEAVGAVIDTAFFLAVETEGNGKERIAIEKVKAETNQRFKVFDEAVKNNNLTGSSRGGYKR